MVHKISGQWIKILVAITCLVVAVGCNWAIPIFYQRVIDIGVLEKDMAVVWKFFFRTNLFFYGICYW